MSSCGDPNCRAAYGCHWVLAFKDKNAIWAPHPNKADNVYWNKQEALEVIKKNKAEDILYPLHNYN